MYVFKTELYLTQFMLKNAHSSDKERCVLFVWKCAHLCVPPSACLNAVCVCVCACVCVCVCACIHMRPGGSVEELMSGQVVKASAESILLGDLD